MYDNTTISECGSRVMGRQANIALRIDPAGTRVVLVNLSGLSREAKLTAYRAVYVPISRSSTVTACEKEAGLDIDG